MMADVEDRREEIRKLCARFGVERLFLFGSAAIGSDSSASDLDFLVEFAARHDMSYDTRYFGLLEGLESLLGRPVDLVVESAIRNPYFRQSVERSKVALYAA